MGTANILRQKRKGGAHCVAISEEFSAEVQEGVQLEGWFDMTWEKEQMKNLHQLFHLDTALWNCSPSLLMFSSVGLLVTV